MPSVTIAAGPQAGKYFELTDRPLCLGRDAARDIQILDPKVSRKHALLRRDETAGCYRLCPLRSLNGVALNGVRIDAETPLRDGDVFTLGDTTLRFSDVSEVDRTNGVYQRKVADAAVRGRSTIV